MTTGRIYNANDYERDLVIGSKIFSDFKKLQTISWQDVKKSLQPKEAAIEFINFRYKNYNSERYWECTDTILYCALIITHESNGVEIIPLFNESELEDILNKYEGNNLNFINGIYGKNSETKTELYKLIWKPLENQLENSQIIYSMIRY